MPTSRSDREPKNAARKPRKAGGDRTLDHGFADKSRGVRLQKALADAGVAARRECEALVLEGAVTVNGRIVDTLPAWVDPTEDRIEVFGRLLQKPEKHYYIVLFKPRGTVCTNSDPEGRPRAIDLVQHPSKPRLYCVGRLDLDSSGLLVLTNDGDFANRLTHPRYGVSKGYEVTLDGRLDDASVAELERRIFGARGHHERESSMRLLKREKDRTVVAIELCEHRNLQVRPLMLELGHPVKKLRRTSFGPLKLKGLGVGEWRELTPREVSELRRSSSGKREIVAAAEPARPRDPEVMAKRTARTLARAAEAALVAEAEAKAEAKAAKSEAKAGRSEAKAGRSESREPRGEPRNAPRSETKNAPRSETKKAPRSGSRDPSPGGTRGRVTGAKKAPMRGVREARADGAKPVEREDRMSRGKDSARDGGAAREVRRAEFPGNALRGKTAGARGGDGVERSSNRGQKPAPTDGSKRSPRVAGGAAARTGGAAARTGGAPGRTGGAPGRTGGAPARADGKPFGGRGPSTARSATGARGSAGGSAGGRGATGARAGKPVTRGAGPAARGASGGRGGASLRGGAGAPRRGGSRR